ncbi:hypothetical protein ASPWEDRAFT_287930 [Aspergillus wentii DTO 134E9]|uniref:Zn(2)-C6 fungal-type domain-containing protein n=1 Tax=Aspergillus wentii DTO 134E9 TaxID=1073089 RepID=A0A1L9S3S7_ASPWE|nr:uncharacterized protein ASPWEDRAFT_287930 [Aspergillus wentii DTO 134E9]OJJ41817.1 hypothetical protein ASPWEDRAFT_287930 [Aspergillus wentii DTO 134E9]
MKTKQKSVCQTCRKRKLGCDGKRPGCSQCVLTGRECDGYTTSWTFIPQKAQPQSLPKTQELRLQPSNDIIQLVINSYIPGSEITANTSDHTQSRICGSWVEALPVLHCRHTPNSVLFTAIQALSTSIISKNALDCLQSYQVAIQTLRKSFTTGHDVDVIAAIMCLTLVEVMLPESASALTAHIKGVGLVLQAHGAESCKSGVLHKLFVGFRPLLITEAFRHRMPIFLAQEDWINVPFSVFTPSPMQNLLSRSVGIPALLQRIDTLLDTPCQQTPDEVRETFFSFIDAMRNLEALETSLHLQAESKTHWSRGADIWYPNVTMANVHTHLWTFKIICLTEMERLGLFFPCIILEDASLSSRFQFDHVQADTVELGRHICQSMEYLLQDEMKLFGPASTFFPLRVVYERFLAMGDRCKEDAGYVEGVVGRLVGKGLRSAPVIIFDVE